MIKIFKVSERMHSRRKSIKIAFEKIDANECYRNRFKTSLIHLNRII